MRSRATKTAAGLAASLMLLGAALLLPAASALAEPPAPVVVLFAEMPDGLVEGGTYEGGEVLRVDEALRFAVVRPQTRSDMTALSSTEGVLSVEDDAEETWIESSGSDPMSSDQYGPAQVRATQAWTTSPGTTAASVCIVDTGLLHTHEEFQDGRYLGGIDFVNRDDNPMDDQGHGTHVAGIAAASTGNGKGIAGIAQVGIYAAKVMDERGRGSPSMIASGIRWCADQGADVITLSLGGRGSSAMKAAVQYADSKGSVLVAAAGNSGPCDNCVAYPAAYPEVLGVTCTTSSAAQCEFSSDGPQADLAAPGDKILSTWRASDSAYKALSGTSMSAPHVAGVAALVRSQAPQLSTRQVAEVLTGTAQDLGKPGRDSEFGAGLVDASAALAAALGKAPAPAPTPAPDASPRPAPEAPRIPTPEAPQQPEQPKQPAQPKPPAEGDGAPMADAGPDRTVQASPGFGAALVPLDGTASSDPDGRLVMALWQKDGRLVGAGLKPILPLKEGVHTVTLTVRDNDGNEAKDTVTITVVPAPERRR